MGTIIDAKVDEGKDTEESDFGKIGASDPVVYQLVRVFAYLVGMLVNPFVQVEGDGRLVPATDEEVMEVEHLLGEDVSGLAAEEATKHFVVCVSNEGLPSKKSDFEGLSQSENTEVDSQKLNARFEHTEVMLQKVKQEDRLRLSSESLNHSTRCMGVNHQPCHKTQACTDSLQPDNTSMETSPSMVLNGSCSAHLGSAETSSGPANEADTSRPAVFEPCASSKPEFSILKEICLDNLSIRELQEAFKATFGRQTSVKDKLWLKRRIAMGLTNPCDVSAMSFVIEDHKIVLKEVKEEPSRLQLKEVKEEPSRLQKSKTESGFLSTDQVADLTISNSQNLPTSPTNQTEDRQMSGKQLRKPLSEYDEKNENLPMEQFASKRVRKPTRRYIEELSGFDTRECTARLLSSVKNSGHGRSPKSRIRPACGIGSQDTIFSTRQDSLGGFGIQVPYVSRLRRGRPRTNLATLMNFADEREKRDAETFKIDDNHNFELEYFDAAGDSIDGNADSQPSSKGGVRRKHHRAWTLGEVLKLVEGVARYGAGRWSEIRRLAFASHSYRTSVDLKDKWRNLLRASLAQGPTDKGAKNSRKHTSMPIPKPILSRVRELAEMQSETGIELGPSKITRHGRRIVQEKGSGFL